MVLLTIPLLLVQNVIGEREKYQQETYADIASSWGHEQRLMGPILTIPYKFSEETQYKLANGESYTAAETEIKYAHFMPSVLELGGELIPETLHRGIYEVPVYLADLNFSGSFAKPMLEEWDDSTVVFWDEAFVSFGLQENKGIDEFSFVADGQPLQIRPGVRGDQSPLTNGIHAVFSAPDDAWDFELKLKLKGSEAFSIVPVGSHTAMDLTSTWTAPSFFGSFLPDERPDDFSEGFQASWDILEINRAIPRKFLDEKIRLDHFAFGVKLKEETSDYSKTERSTKYALLFIVLVFVALVAVQLVRGFWFHPLQLGILGIGLVLFYLLLLSLSEIIGFNAAYLTASIVMTLQMGWYLHTLTKKWKTTLACVAVLSVLYVFTFVLVQMVMYSLLVGSLGLVVALAVIMALSRRLPDLASQSAKEPLAIPEV